ncbi:hypothetical protein EG329_008657 [Mollisiaceae sp. DMI_Dod_QoI]|nr:hypothetical protein EG329_008657 [Helotiales sp. DMI_Dod_QoI]
MENTMSFYAWSMRNYVIDPRPLTADQALRVDLDAYEDYLDGLNQLDQLRDFRNRRRQLIPLTAGVYSRRTPHGGVVHGSTAHFESFIEACRRDGQTRGMDEPDFDELAHYVWASGREPDVPQWVQTSFERSVEWHAEEVRREFYGQPRIEQRRPQRRIPFRLPVLPGAAVATPQPLTVRSHFYFLLDESESYEWGYGNPVPGILQTIIPYLTHLIALQEICSEENWRGWHSQASMAVELMNEAARSELRRHRRNHVTAFDVNEPRDSILLEIESLDLNLGDWIDRMSIPESIHRMSIHRMSIHRMSRNRMSRNRMSRDRSRVPSIESEDSSGSIRRDDLETQDGNRMPARPDAPSPSQGEVQDLLWNIAAQEETLDDVRAALIDMADQSDVEDEDSHARFGEDWFERGNILEDRRPADLGPPRHPPMAH